MHNSQQTILAPELAVSHWFNTKQPLTLAGLHGKPVWIHTFQLLCPGCVSDAIPQLRRVEKAFAHTDLQIIGLHTVFEHHAAMSPVTLEAFLHEYRITTPVGVDLADPSSDVPMTMQRYGFRGTPSSVLIGRDGSIIHGTFGVEDDIALGARIATALASSQMNQAADAAQDGSTSCVDGRCEIIQAQ
ncbi:peroxiredoxin family protein [Agrobacterium tumefaciens]|uniref:peroxiredoxin family protein n=1 Tax=Agrobacterium tumefaciens TaxID=358 RepID=UPI003B9E15CD